MSEPVQYSVADRDRSKIVRRMSAVLLLLLLVVAAEGWQIAAGMTVKAQSWEYIIEGPSDDQLQSRLSARGGWVGMGVRATCDR